MEDVAQTRNVPERSPGLKEASFDEDEDSQLVELLYLVPRSYLLLAEPGWENIVVDGVAIP